MCIIIFKQFDQIYFQMKYMGINNNNKINDIIFNYIRVLSLFRYFNCFLPRSDTPSIMK